MTEEWKPNHSDLSDTIHKCRGNISATGKKLGVSKETIFKYIRENPIYREIVEEARRQHSEDEIELAVSLNYKFMQAHDENPGLASKHCIFTLERKGHGRGYVRDSSDTSQNKDIENKFDESMAHVLSLLSPERNMDDSNINNDTKS